MPTLKETLEFETNFPEIVHNALKDELHSDERAKIKMAVKENKIIFTVEASDKSALKAAKGTIERLAKTALSALNI